MREEEFRNRYKQTENVERSRSRSRNRYVGQIYTAPKGSSYRAYEGKKKSKKNIFKRTAAGVLAAISLGAAATRIIKENSKEEITLTNLIEEQEKVSQLGLSQETMKKLVEMGEYFENIDMLEVSGYGLLEKSDEIKQLIETCVKEKVANVTGYEAKDFDISLREDISSEIVTIVSIYAKANYRENKAAIAFVRDNSILGATRTMPKEMYDIIVTAKQKLPNLDEQIRNKKISNANALKELEEYFKELDNFNSYELIKGKNDKLVMASYAEQMKKLDKKLDKKEEQER